MKIERFGFHPLQPPAPLPAAREAERVKESDLELSADVFIFSKLEEVNSYFGKILPSVVCERGFFGIEALY